MSLAPAFLIVAVIAALLGFVFFLVARSYLQTRNLRPDITLEQIRRDVAAAKDIGS
jgi:hypothetical protein